MSLDWNIEDVKGQKKLCWEPIPCEYCKGEGTKKGATCDGCDGKGERVRLNPVTESLIWKTIAVDIGHITEKTAGEFYARVALMERIDGVSVYAMKDGKRVDRPITPKDVRDHIGLRTNVITKLGRAAWMKRVLGRILNEYVREFDK